MGVMGVKANTKQFQPAQEKPTSANAALSNISATDKNKINGENVGDALNKLADPNWVDPSKKMRTVGNANLDKDAFFKLMLAQLKNQDPTNPLKSHEMAAQLANFSSLEQMQNMNTTLTEMKNGQKPMEQYQALNLIGKAVSGDSSKLVRVKGDKDHDFRFNLPMDSKDVTIKLKNGEGETVRVYDMKNLKKGDNKITWNGKDDRNLDALPGEYTFSIEAKGPNDGKIAVKTDFGGVITGVNYTPEGPVLMIGNQTIRLKDVRKIQDPSLMSNDQKATDVTAQDLKKDGAVADTDKKEDSAAAKPASEAASKPAPEVQGTHAAVNKIMDSVGMSRDMISKLQKETR
jgi:flagellar basal-body rod modification protein FlgD